MTKPKSLIVLLLMLTLIIATPILSQVAAAEEVQLVVIELRKGAGQVVVYQIPPEDDSMTNPHYVLAPWHWQTTARYVINVENPYGFTGISVVTAITASAQTWDDQTSARVFSYQGTTRWVAGTRDGRNVISWGTWFNQGVIAVCFIWIRNSRIIESDTLMNNYFNWSLSGEADKMDVQDVMTHELGHWVGLADLYDDVDYWLTMYGYGNFGETYKRTLGLGDILGLRAVYGP